MTEDRKKILILFEGLHLAYSPTVLQLYDALSANYDVTILAPEPVGFGKEGLENRNVLYHTYKPGKWKFFQKRRYKFLSHFSDEIKTWRKNGLSFGVYVTRFSIVKKLCRSNNYHRVISVDIENLFYCSLLKQRTDFLSLELGYRSELLPAIDLSVINAVIIQSPERYHYLFNGKDLKVFYVQNAPVFKEIEIRQKREGLIYAGTARDRFGFYQCLKYIEKYEDETLTLQGAILPDNKKRTEDEYGKLISENRLRIPGTYMEDDKMIEFISEFEIGFCFYDFSFPDMNTFNYYSAPSGKLFKYLAAGVPVVCNDIIGFKFVKEFGCGVLIPDLKPETIRIAVSEIRNNYKSYVENAIIAAKHYSFDKAILPYLDSLDS